MFPVENGSDADPQPFLGHFPSRLYAEPRHDSDATSYLALGPNLMPVHRHAARGGIGQHSLLAQLQDDEPAVVTELVALVTDLKAEGGVGEVRGV